MLSVLLLPCQGENSSDSSPAPAWGPSHGRQSSTNLSNKNFSHRLKFFTIYVSVHPFYTPSPWGAIPPEQAAPAWVPHRVKSPASNPPAWSPPSSRVHRSCQEPAPAQASHCFTASFRHAPVPVWGPPWAAGGYLLQPGPPWAAGGQPVSPCSSSQAAGEILCSGAWSTSSPSFFTDLAVFRAVSLTWSPSSLLTAVPQQVFPLLKYVITEVLLLLLTGTSLGQWQVPLRARWHWLYQTWGKLLAASHGSYLYRAPTTKALPHKPTTHRLVKYWNRLT